MPFNWVLNACLISHTARTTSVLCDIFLLVCQRNQKGLLWFECGGNKIILLLLILRIIIHYLKMHCASQGERVPDS